MQFIPCSHRYPRAQVVDLIVIHTNEGPEGPVSAENLANYLARPDVIPGYHYVVDENSAVQCAHLNESVNGAGGVNSRAVHICITGYAAQDPSQWNDSASIAAIERAAAIATEVSRQLGVPWTKITDPRPLSEGICGHADVSRYYSLSAGHYDPGPNFPWGRFLAANLDDMSAEDVAAIKAHIDNASLLTAAAIFAEVNPRLEKIEADVKNVRQAVRDGEGKSIPAKTYRLLEAGNTPDA